MTVGTSIKSTEVFLETFSARSLFLGLRLTSKNKEAQIQTSTGIYTIRGSFYNRPSPS